ncbi:hypothetical protein CTP10_R34270 [Cupriavidus sp. P-10]|uniref:hypothetical protein n=1 Tax=unclassified Cupriavidus TaxID=2640874 RepID=UPI000E2E6BD6|nr:hypothetical protein [Cupriavidus sp. P-10]BDB26032.1 hypothetical protein CTP10_R34270 [Cupriavidus sp. P-10]
MQSLLSVLALIILAATAAGLASPRWLSETLLGGRPVTRLQVAVVGLCLAAFCLILVGRLAQGGASG